MYIDEYLESLSTKEKQVIEIAKQQLGSSFNILKSIGYLNWFEKKEKA
jgi:transcriptional regulator CtsR